MAQIRFYPGFRHLRAEPNEFILHFARGRLVRSGAGQSYFFHPLSASVAQVPVEDCETTFMLSERTSDFQEVAAQCVISYRFADPKVAASRLNFSLSLDTGLWLEKPLERVAAFWMQRAQQPTRAYLTRMPVVEAIRSGAQAVRDAIESVLRADPEVGAMGLALVNVQVVRIAPLPEVDKSLQTPTREAIQQRADEAVFARRASAVEKERAIKENELATQIELARRQEDLVRREGANALLRAQQDATTEQAKVEASTRRTGLLAKAAAEEEGLRAVAAAETQRLVALARAQGERELLDVYRDAPPRILTSLLLREIATKLRRIQHLNVTPDLLASSLQQLLRDNAEK